MNHCQIVEVGQCIAKKMGKETVCGWECLCTDNVTGVGLRLQEDDNVCGAPHANIVDWPCRQEDSRRLQNMLVRLSSLITA
jgi:hypothetical protein